MGNPNFFVGAGLYVWLRVGYLCWAGRGSIQEVEGVFPGKGLVLFSGSDYLLLTALVQPQSLIQST